MAAHFVLLRTLSFTLSRTRAHSAWSGLGRMFAHEKLQVYAKALDWAAKAAVYLDVCVRQKLWQEAEVAPGKELLRQVGALVLGFA